MAKAMSELDKARKASLTAITNAAVRFSSAGAARLRRLPAAISRRAAFHHHPCALPLTLSPPLTPTPRARLLCTRRPQVFARAEFAPLVSKLQAAQDVLVLVVDFGAVDPAAFICRPPPAFALIFLFVVSHREVVDVEVVDVVTSIGLAGRLESAILKLMSA